MLSIRLERASKYAIRWSMTCSSCASFTSKERKSTTLTRTVKWLISKTNRPWKTTAQDSKTKEPAVETEVSAAF